MCGAFFLQIILLWIPAVVVAQPEPQKDKPKSVDDPIRAKLDAAKADYDKAMKEYREEVAKWFEKEDEAARRLKTGVGEKVKQVALEKKEFDEKGILPKRAPLVLKDKPLKTAQALIAIFKAASEAYYREKKDSEGEAVLKSLEEIKKNIGATSGAAIDQFVGRWRIVASNGAVACYFTLTDKLEARKSHTPETTGKWEVVGNEARITWSDGWRDILRPQKGSVLKIAFSPGTSWDDPPANTDRAIKEKK
jgi:hypothetical protein